jgi:hypothetical protein
MKKLDQSDKEDRITTIKVLTSTRDKLAKLGTMDDNYDTVINRLIKEYEDTVINKLIKETDKGK